MPSTYLKLVNDVLVHLGETELTVSNFNDARSIFKTIKNAVNQSIAHINSQEYEWPFNAYEHNHSLVPGKEEYVWPDNHKSTDWESFEIDKSEALGINTHHLRKINRDEWYARRRDQDQDAGAVGKGLPNFVFEAHGNGFGVTPSPDKAYTIRYRYFRAPTPLVNSTDEPIIPSQWDHVIFLGALYYGNLFKESPEGTSRVEKKFEDALDAMRKILINKTEDMTSGMINYGGSYFTASRYLFRD